MVLLELDEPPHAASNALRPIAAAPPWPPRISRSRRFRTMERSVIGARFRSRFRMEGVHYLRNRSWIQVGVQKSGFRARAYLIISIEFMGIV